MRQIIYLCLLSCLVLQLSAQENEEKKAATLVFHFSTTILRLHSKSGPAP